MSTSIYDASSIYDSYSRNLNNASASKINSQLNTLGDDSTDEELLNACKEFEEYFVQKIIEQARKSVAGEEEDGEYMKYFGDTLNQSYAEAIVDGGGVGLAQQLYESMKGTSATTIK